MVKTQLMVSICHGLCTGEVSVPFFLLWQGYFSVHEEDIAVTCHCHQYSCNQTNSFHFALCSPMSENKQVLVSLILVI